MNYANEPFTMDHHLLRPLLQDFWGVGGGGVKRGVPLYDDCHRVSHTALAVSHSSPEQRPFLSEHSPPNRLKKSPAVVALRWKQTSRHDRLCSSLYCTATDQQWCQLHRYKLNRMVYLHHATIHSPEPHNNRNKQTDKQNATDIVSLTEVITIKNLRQQIQKCNENIFTIP